MRKVNYIIINILFIIWLIASLQYYETNQFDVLTDYVTKFNIEFVNDDPTADIQSLFDIATEENVDVFRVDYKYSKGNKYFYNVYLNPNNPNSILNPYRVDTQQLVNDKSLSTYSTISNERIATYNKNKEYTVYNACEIIKNENPSSTYMVFDPNGNNTNDYISRVSKELPVKIKNYENTGYSSSNTVVDMYKSIIIFFIIVLFVLNIMIIIRSQKAFAIYRLHGNTKSNVFASNLSSFSKNILKIYVVYLIILIIWLLVNGYPLKIIETSGIFLLLISTIIVITFSCSQLYYLRIKIINALKNKRNDSVLETIFFFIKCMLQFVLVLALVTLISNSSTLFGYLGSYNNWKQTSNIAYTKLYTTTESSEDMIAFGKELELLYNDIEENLSAILVDSSKIKTSLSDPYCEGDNFYQPDCSGVIVNENYLKTQSQLATYIPRTLKENTIIVPNKYKKDENTLQLIYKRYFYLINNDIQDEFDPLYNEEQMKKEPINIIWTDNVSVFTANIEISSDGMLSDPILVVPNKLAPTGYIQAFSNGSIFFKIDDPNNPYKTIEKYLKKYGLTNEIKTTPTVLSRYATTIQSYEAQLIEGLIKLILLLIMTYVIFTNNIVIFYTKNIKRCSIQKMYGFSQFTIYKAYLFEVIYSWLGTVILYLLANKIGLQVIDKEYMFLALVVILATIEVFISLLYFRRLEKTNLIKVLKEN